MGQICFVILTLALATFNFSLVSGSFLVILQGEGRGASKHARVLTPTKTKTCGGDRDGGRRVALGCPVAGRWRICLFATCFSSVSF